MSSSQRAPVGMASGITAQLYHLAVRPVIHLRELAREPRQKKEFFMQMIRHAGVLIALLILPSSIYSDENVAKLSDAVKSAKVSRSKQGCGRGENPRGRSAHPLRPGAKIVSPAISVVPELKASHPIATITLSKDHETLTATEKLD